MRRFLIMALLIAWPLAGNADEISGDWCSDGGANVRIEGDQIRSPGGQMTSGLYSRHSFEFIVPDGEAEAGLTIFLQQLSEEQVRVTYEGRDPEIWNRCEMVS